MEFTLLAKLKFFCTLPIRLFIKLLTGINLIASISLWILFHSFTHVCISLPCFSNLLTIGLDSYSYSSLFCPLVRRSLDWKLGTWIWGWTISILWNLEMSFACQEIQDKCSIPIDPLELIFFPSFSLQCCYPAEFDAHANNCWNL